MISEQEGLKKINGLSAKTTPQGLGSFPLKTTCPVKEAHSAINKTNNTENGHLITMELAPSYIGAY